MDTKLKLMKITIFSKIHYKIYLFMIIIYLNNSNGTIIIKYFNKIIKNMQSD